MFNAGTLLKRFVYSYMMSVFGRGLKRDVKSSSIWINKDLFDDSYFDLGMVHDCGYLCLRWKLSLWGHLFKTPFNEAMHIH